MKFLRITLIVCGLLLFPIATVVAQHQDECKRDSEPVGGFSFCVPEGWSIKARENEKYRALFAPAVDNFTANINFKDEESRLALANYVGSSIKTIVNSAAKLEASSIKLVGWTDFATTGGLNGNRVVFETEYKGMLIRTVQFYLDGGERKFVLTGTCMVKDKDKFDVVFESTAKSFRLDK